MSAKIYNQISLIMADIDAIGKSQRNQSQGYSFRGVDDVYNELHSLFARHKVFTMTEVLEHTREERPTKSGGVMTYSLMKIMFTFYADDGSKVVSIVIGEGSDSGDKSSNKAMAIAHKYALVQAFVIPTKDDKDPENHSPEFKAPTPPQATKGPTEAQLKRLMAITLSAGYDYEFTTRKAREVFKVSVNDLNKIQYDQLCNYLEKNPVGGKAEEPKPPVKKSLSGNKPSTPAPSYRQGPPDDSDIPPF